MLVHIISPWVAVVGFPITAGPECICRSLGNTPDKSREEIKSLHSMKRMTLKFFPHQNPPRDIATLPWADFIPFAVLAK